MRGWWLRVWRLLNWRQTERDIREELRFHVEMEAEKNLRLGLSPEEARRKAIIDLGGEDRWRETTRDARGTRYLEETARDLRYAWRGLIRSPGLALAAIGTLGLGVGATTAIYSVVDQVVFSPLPYPESRELVAVWSENPTRGIERGMTSWPNFEDWRASTESLRSIAAIVHREVTLTSGGSPERLRYAAVSNGFFELLGAPTALGRSPRAEEGELNETSVAVLSWELFERRFGADPSVIGSTIDLDDRPVEVIGVLEAGRAYPTDAELWMPISFGSGRQWRDPRQRAWLSVVGRLAEGTTLESAQQEWTAIAGRLAQSHPDSNRDTSIRLESLQDTVVGQTRAGFLLLLGAVSVLLVITIVNVANLLLARGTSMTREWAARLAMGAGRGRIARQVMVFSAVLGAMGGVVGTVVAVVGVTGLLRLAPPELPRLETVAVDGGVLIASLFIAAGASGLFGLLPAWRATRVDPAASLRSAGRTSASRGLVRVRGAFVAGQFALAFMLLAAAGLLGRSFAKLRGVDPGFTAEQVLSLSLALPGSRYAEQEDYRAFHDELLAAVDRLPEVVAVGSIGGGMFVDEDRATGALTIESRPDQYTEGAEPAVVADGVSPGFFAAAGMRLVAGRGFTPSDGPDDPAVAVVNEAFVKAYLDGIDPIGQSYVWGRPAEGKRSFTIVGVVADVHRAGLERADRPASFVPTTQNTPSRFELLVRTEGDALAAVGAVRGVIEAMDDRLPIVRVRTLEQALDASMAERRYVMWLVAAFALSALLLAAVGIFGVIDYVVGQRTREIGIRVALGAARTTIQRRIVQEALHNAGWGLAVGVVLAVVFSGWIDSQLYGLSATDPATFVGALAALGGIAVAASVIPARRAARIDAMAALREE